MCRISVEGLVSAARSQSLHAGGGWAVLLASIGFFGCAEVGDVTDHSALASESQEVVMHDSLGTELAPISAAAVSSNAAADRDLNLLARIEVQPNELLEIYEPSPGLLLLSGVGAPDSKALLTPRAIESMSVEEIWQLGAGSADMPRELRAAIARANTRAEAAGRVMPEGIEPSYATPFGASAPPVQVAADLPPVFPSAGWCDTEYYYQGYGDCPNGYDFSVCWDSVGGNGGWASADYVSHVYTNVCAAAGQVMLYVSSAHGGGGYWTVDQDTTRWWSQSYWGCGNDCLRVRADVLDAGPDRFHFRFLTIY